MQLLRITPHLLAGMISLLLLQGCPKKQEAKKKEAGILDRLGTQILNMAGLSSLKVSDAVARPSSAAIQIVGDLEVYLAGVIDPAKEEARLKQQLEKLNKEAAKAKARLENDNFISRAPADVVAAEKKKWEELLSRIDLVKKGLKTDSK